jgi:hypothetical protein
MLLEVIRATGVGHEGYKCNPALLNGTMLLKYDILNLAALVAIHHRITQERNFRPTWRKLVELFHNASLWTESFEVARIGHRYGLALDWMDTKVHQGSVESSLAPLE